MARIDDFFQGDDDYVSRGELKRLIAAQNKLLGDFRVEVTPALHNMRHVMDDLSTRLDTVENKVATSSTFSSTSEYSEASENSCEEEDEKAYGKQDWRSSNKGKKPHRPPPPPPRRGNKGNKGNKGDNYNQFARVKFKISPFDGSYDANAYLDCEMTVEQKFNSHMIPANQRSICY